MKQLTTPTTDLVPFGRGEGEELFVQRADVFFSALPTLLDELKTFISEFNQNAPTLDALFANKALFEALSSRVAKIDAISASLGDIDLVIANLPHIEGVFAKLSKIEAVANDLTKLESVANNMEAISAVCDKLGAIEIANTKLTPELLGTINTINSTDFATKLNTASAVLSGINIGVSGSYTVT